MQSQTKTNELSTAKPAELPQFPYLLVGRWLIAATLLFFGVRHLITLIQNWSFWTEQAVIDPAYSPYPWLALELCILAAGILLFLRSKWVFMPVILHILLFGKQMWPEIKGGDIPVAVYGFWTVELLVLCFCFFLWRKGRLQ